MNMDPSSFHCQGGQFYFMKNFNPLSTPATEFSNPGTCNVKLHNIFTPLLFRSTEKVVTKETVSSTTLLPSTVQEGGKTSDSEEEMFKYPIKVSKTLLLQHSIPEKKNSESTSGEKAEKKDLFPPPPTRAWVKGKNLTLK